MRKIIYLIPLLIFGCKSATTVSEAGITSDSVKDSSKISYKVEERSVSETLRALTSDAFEGREAGTEGINKAGAYLEKLLVQYKVRPYFQSYRDTLSNFKGTTFNIVGVIEGNDPALKNEFVILGAHYDHIGISKDGGVNGDIINNGANDDASGVTAVAEIAKYFGEHKTNKRSIIIAFFTAEEAGLLGSEHLSEKLKKRNLDLYSMLNFEMIGVPMRADHTAYITGFSKSTMAAKLNEYAGKKLVGYFPMEFQYQLFMRSDNYPFFKQFSVPCQTVCTFDFENYAYYHHVDDEFELMDTKHMTSFIQDILPVVEKMANSREKEIVLK